jgi:hypothetical protein
MTMLNDWLQDTPSAVYGSWMQNTPFGSPAQKRYFEGQGGQMHNRYMGELGSQAQSGQMPTLDYSSYLSGFSPNNYYQSLPNWMRGVQHNVFSPSLRWLMY